MGRLARPRPGKVAEVYIVATRGLEDDKVAEWLRTLEELAPQEEMREAARARALQPIVIDRELMERILSKRPRELTEEEREALLIELAARGVDVARDIARESKRKARSVRSWLMDPRHKDLPGVDTPEARKIWRRVRRKRKVPA